MKRLVHDYDGCIFETDLSVSEHGVSLDEWDGFNMTTGGVGLHQTVFLLYEEDHYPSNDTYLLEKSSQWQGSLVEGEVLSREGLIDHLNSIDRDVDFYMEKLDSIRDHDKQTAKAKCNDKNKESDLER